MKLFDWPFKTGDRVETRDGKEGKVQGFKPEGFVDIRVRDENGGHKTITRFGSTIERKK